MLFKLYQFYESKNFFAFIVVVWLILRLCFWVCILIMLEMRGVRVSFRAKGEQIDEMRGVRVLQPWELMTFYQGIFVIDYPAQRIVKISMCVLVYGPPTVHNICAFSAHFLLWPKTQLFPKNCVLGWTKRTSCSSLFAKCAFWAQNAQTKGHLLFRAGLYVSLVHFSISYHHQKIPA